MTQQDELRGRRILVVEDEYFIAVDIKEKLEAAGAVVVGPVATIGKALSLLATETLDGAILDLNLGGQMGFRVGDAFKERAIPFVLPGMAEPTSAHSLPTWLGARSQSTRRKSPPRSSNELISAGRDTSIRNHS